MRRKAEKDGRDHVREAPDLGVEYAEPCWVVLGTVFRSVEILIRVAKKTRANTVNINRGKESSAPGFRHDLQGQ